MNEPDQRYGFTCPACSGSFSISLEKIPPVQARFSCPKCGKAMDFPSREEARVYVSLQSGGGVAPAEPSPAPSAPAAAPTPRPASVTRTPAPEAGAGEGTGVSSRAYRLQRPGFENDVFDRRAMRNLIRSGDIMENDSVSVDSDPSRRANDIPELKSLFDLRKSSRLQPPAVCRKHTERVAHYLCSTTQRPLCEECAEEKKFGGASVRVCDHCGGTAAELPVPEES